MLVGTLLKVFFVSIFNGVFQPDVIPKQLCYTFEGRVVINKNSNQWCQKCDVQCL